MPSKSNEAMPASSGVRNSCKRDSHSDALPSTEACRTMEESGPVSSDGDVPLPWWYTPRRLLVWLPCCFPRVDHMLAKVEGKQTQDSVSSISFATDLQRKKFDAQVFNLSVASMKSTLVFQPVQLQPPTGTHVNENVIAVAGTVLLRLVSGVCGYGAAVQQWRDWY